jgi:hypothetical protein
MKYLTGLFIIILMLFSIWFFLFNSYYQTFKIPFGQDDVDNYWCWFKGLKSIGNRYQCPAFEGYSKYVHISFISFIWFLGEPGKILTLFIPYCIWWVIPIIYFLFIFELCKNSKTSFYTTLMFIFGSFTLTFFSIVAVWCQMVSFIFFILSMLFYHSDNKGFFYLSAFLSVLFHPIGLGIYVIFFLSSLLEKKKYRLLLILSILFFITLFFMNKLELITFFDHRVNQPSIYQMFSILTCPILIPFFFLGLDKKHRFYTFTVVLFLLMPFVQIGRGLPYLHLFFCFFAYKGLCKIDDKYMKTFIALFILFSFANYFNMQLDYMYSEFVKRGLSQRLFLKFLSH